MGANVYGEIGQERLTFNQKTLWNGGPSENRPDYDGGNKETADNGQKMSEVYKEIIELYKEGNDAQANELAKKLTGEVDGYGAYQSWGDIYVDFGLKEEQHPLTGVEFAGYEIPFWKEVVDLVKNAHAQFYSLQSIGWDIVITEKGPVLLEGNDDWEIGGPQDTYGGLKKRWNELRKA